MSVPMTKKALDRWLAKPTPKSWKEALEVQRKEHEKWQQNPKRPTA